MTERIERTNEGIDRLRETVTTGFDELRQSVATGFNKLKEGFSRLEQASQQQLDIARQQNESIQRLTEAQETTVRQQADIVAAQTANVSRLIELLDRSN